jgi:alkylation response protein AidB-like acyl-CoA dehydrogenase
MDVTVPGIPARYDSYRDQLRAFIAAHKPELGWKKRSGLRAPDNEGDVHALRAWVRALYDAGYRLERFLVDEDVDPYEQRIMEQELSATGVPFVLGNPLVAEALKEFGTAAQQARYLPPMARGDEIWTQLFSEPNAGSDLASLETRARQDGDGYVVRGQKLWSTWAQWSDFGYLLARTEPVPGPAGITAFVIDLHAPGVEVRPLREITGTTDFNEVFLDDVRAPRSGVIGAPGQGWRVANASLMAERGGVGAGGGGTADAAVALVGLARRARRGGRAAIEDGAVRQAIGALAARARIQRALGYHTATRAAAGMADASDAALTKVWFSELNLEIAEYALGLQGGRGVLVEGDAGAVDDGVWQDRFLYARAWTIAGGTNEIMRNVIAERGLGLPKEPRGDRPSS